MQRESLSFSKGVLESPVLRKLSNEQRQALLARLNYIIELSDKLKYSHTSPRVRHLIDDIELDAWVNLGAPEDGIEREISSWLIDTSWSSECENFAPSSLLDHQLLQRLGSSPDASTPAALNEWLSKQARHLRVAAQGAIDAADICTLVAHIMAMNVLLLDLLSSIGRARIHSQL